MLKKTIIVFGLLLHSFASILAQQTSTNSNDNYIITKRILTVQDGLPNNVIFCAIQDKDGFMWFGTENGLSRFDGKNFTNYTKEKDGLTGNIIVQLAIDDLNQLLIYSGKTMEDTAMDLCMMDLKTYAIRATSNKYAVLKYRLNWDINVKSNFKYANNAIALQLNNERIDIYSKEELINLPSLSFYFNYLDRYGNNWLCANFGVFEISCRKKLFVNYFNRQQPTDLLDKQVRNIYTEANFKDKSNQSDEDIYANMGDKLFIQQNNGIQTIIKSTDVLFSLLKTSGKIYVGGTHLFVFDQKKLQFKKIDTLFAGELWALYLATPHEIYTGRSGGIFLQNESTTKIEKLKATNNSFPLPIFVYRFVQTRQHGLIAVAQNGLFQIKDKFIVDYYGPAATSVNHQLPIASIYDMQEDKDGVCWIASNGNGLFRWNWAATNIKGALQNFTVEAGLPSNILCRIEEDGYSNLWVSTFNGLFSFNKNNQSFQIFNTSDGIINNEFNRVSSFKGPDGRLYFGTVNGLTAFYPDEVLKQSTINPVPFRITIINKYSAAKDVFEPCINEYKANNRIVMKPGEGLLSVEFSLLDFQNRKYLYQYKIEGMPGKWKLLEGKSLNISSLPYGEFTVKIKAQLANGSWNPVEIAIPIVVLKPYYLQTWFIVLGIIVLTAATRWYYSTKTKKLLQRKTMLESLVEKKTTSLSTALEDKELLLKEVHHRVKNNLQVIISLLHLQNDKITDQTMKAAILESQSRIGSIALLHQNLYQNDKLDGIRFDEFVNSLGKQLADFYKYLHNKIELETNITNTCIDIDTAVPLGLILNELFSNTHKHAFKNTSLLKVTVSMQEISTGAYKLVFHDSGPGLSEEIGFINAKTLGLELIRGLAKQLHGEAIYQYKQGSEFTIFFKNSITRKNS